MIASSLLFTIAAIPNEMVVNAYENHRYNLYVRQLKFTRPGEK